MIWTQCHFVKSFRIFFFDGRIRESKFQLLRNHFFFHIDYKKNTGLILEKSMKCWCVLFFLSSSNILFLTKEIEIPDCNHWFLLLSISMEFRWFCILLMKFSEYHTFVIEFWLLVSPFFTVIFSSLSSKNEM